ncbi:MAG: AMP-binding protein [Chloroflexota bacterium]|nr:AMP-binding protein [Chloroflexota bacterium]
MDQHPWFKSYDDDVPHTLKPYPHLTLLDVMSQTANDHPLHPALLFKGKKISYARLEHLSDAFASALVKQGVCKGDRVVVLMPNSPQTVIAQLGIWKAGAIAAMTNPLYKEYELSRLMTECQAETAVVLSRFYEKIKSIQPHTNLSRLIVTNIKEYLPAHLKILYTIFKEAKEGDRVLLRDNDMWMSDLLKRHENSPRPNIVIKPEDPALLLFSGGTTGIPKGAIGTHHAMFISGLQLSTWFKGVLREYDDIIVLAMPLFHVYGNVGVFATGIAGHNTFAIIPNPRDLNDLVGTIRKVRPAFLPGVPSLFIALLDHSEVIAGKVDFKSIKLCISGAAPLLDETRDRFESLTGGRMLEGYGLTESMMGAIISPIHSKHKPGAVGLPLPDIEIRIADSGTGIGSLPPGDVGEILMKAPQLMMGYFDREDETAQAIRDGWLYTGDLGYMDSDGYVFIVDRKKDVIKPSGFQVWPREVEEVLAMHSAVREVGVAGVPDPQQGEAVKAWIVLNEGQQPTIDELKDYCRERLAGYKVPKQIEFRSELPKTMIGKVLRRELVADEDKVKVEARPG